MMNRRRKRTDIDVIEKMSAVKEGIIDINIKVIEKRIEIEEMVRGK